MFFPIEMRTSPPYVRGRTDNQHFNQLMVEQVPDKTLTGCNDKLFDFLDYRFGE